MTELAEWLLGCIADDEATATAVGTERQDWWVHVFQADADVVTEVQLQVARQDGPVLARTAAPDGSALGDSDVAILAQAANFDPTRVLAECAAKRRIITRAETAAAVWKPFSQAEEPTAPGIEALSAVASVYDDVLRDLAQPYADRAGYQPEWQSHDG